MQIVFGFTGFYYLVIITSNTINSFNADTNNKDQNQYLQAIKTADLGSLFKDIFSFFMSF